MTRMTKNFINGSEFWVNSENMTLWEILSESRLPEKWKRFDLIEDIYDKCLIKPINRYVSNLYSRPEIVSIDEDEHIVILRQKTHAEIWVQPNKKNLYALDKAWQRQFYPSSNYYSDHECFNATYKFYVPWFIDDNIEATISNCNGSPFKINTKNIKFSRSIMSERFPEYFVDFKIKKDGSHMLGDQYGIVDIGTPMYDIIIKLDSDQIEKVYNQYGK